MLWVGVDPGKSGAVAVLFDGPATAVVYPIPLIVSAKGRDEYDLAAIRDLLVDLQQSAMGRGAYMPFVTVEKTQPMPPSMRGSLANFGRGVGRGWEWMLVALRIPCFLVAPRTWQKSMHAGTPGADTKQRSIIAAQRLFPGASLKRTERCRKDDDGIAEALLLAEYGRRVHAGAEEKIA